MHNAHAYGKAYDEHVSSVEEALPDKPRCETAPSTNDIAAEAASDFCARNNLDEQLQSKMKTAFKSAIEKAFLQRCIEGADRARERVSKRNRKAHASEDLGQLRRDNASGGLGLSREQIDALINRCERLENYYERPHKFEAGKNSDVCRKCGRKKELHRTAHASEDMNERLAFETLSKSLTGGNAKTWHEIFHAAESRTAQAKEVKKALRSRATRTGKAP